MACRRFAISFLGVDNGFVCFGRGKVSVSGVQKLTEYFSTATSNGVLVVAVAALAGAGGVNQLDKEKARTTARRSVHCFFRKRCKHFLGVEFGCVLSWKNKGDFTAPLSLNENGQE